MNGPLISEYGRHVSVFVQRRPRVRLNLDGYLIRYRRRVYEDHRDKIDMNFHGMVRSFEHSFLPGCWSEDDDKVSAHRFFYDNIYTVRKPKKMMTEGFVLHLYRVVVHGI